MPDVHRDAASLIVLLILTYGLHSTLSLALASFLDRLSLAASARSHLWRLAVVVPLAMTLLFFPASTGDGDARLANSSMEPLVHLTSDSGSSKAPASTQATWFDHASGSPTSRSEAGAQIVPDVRLERLQIDVPRAFFAGPAELLAAVWIAGALLRLLLLMRGEIILWWFFRDRVPVVEGRAVEILGELTRKAGFRRTVGISAHPECPVPLAFGWRQICLPDGFVQLLSEEELKAALAHELGHLARFDGLWNVLIRVVAAVCFFQPLHALALRRLEDASEEAADEWALRLTRSPLALARCLESVGAMVLLERASQVPVTSLVSSESSLVRRVRLILAYRDRGSGKALRQSVAIVGLFCCVTALAPTLAGPETRTNEDAPRTAAISDQAEPGPRKRSEEASAEVGEKVDVVVASQGQANPEGQRMVREGSLRLARMLSDPDPAVRRDAVDAIGREERWSDVPEVFRMASDSDSMVRWQLATVIGLTEPQEGIPALASLLRDSSALVRHSAAWAVTGFELAQLRSSGALEALIARSSDASSRVRRQVAATLAILEPESGIPALLELVDDESAAVRATAAWGLGEYGREDLTRRLLLFADDPSPAVRRQTTSALARTPHEDWRPVLIRLSSDEDPEVRWRASHALGELPQSP